MTARTVFAEFPAGHPRGVRPADERAAELTRAGTPATVRQVIDRDVFIVVPAGES